MKLDPKLITSWVAVGLLAVSGLSWAWNMHNEFLMDTISPLLRTAYVQRINNYRKKQCMGDYSDQVELDQVMADYEKLVGRSISDRNCETL